MFDFGAPVGFRLATRDPDRITALVIQNGNAYEEGLGPKMQGLKPYWADRIGQESAIRGLLEPDVTRSQYVDGVPDQGTVNPDLWELDQRYIELPGRDRVMLDLLFDYQSNVALYPSWSHTTEGLDAARAIRSELPQIGILVLSAHVEVHRALDLLAEGQGVGYLLKHRVTAATDFLESLERIAGGGSVIDPGLVMELVTARRSQDRLSELTPREHEVLRLMAEGRSNAGIARLLVVTGATVEKHVHSILAKLGLSETPDDHRRMLAVIAFLGAR